MTLGAGALTGACLPGLRGRKGKHLRNAREREKCQQVPRAALALPREQLSETMMATPPDICDGCSAYLTRTRSPALGTGPSSPSVTLAPGSQKRRGQQAQRKLVIKNTLNTCLCPTCSRCCCCCSCLACSQILEFCHKFQWAY